MVTDRSIAFNYRFVQLYQSLMTVGESDETMTGVPAPTKLTA